MDKGRRDTDKRLIALEKRMAREYEQAYNEMKAQADAYFKRFEQADAEKRRALKSGEITLKDYKKWRQAEMASGNRYNAMVRSLASKMTRTNQNVMAMLKKDLMQTYADNYNYGGYEVAKQLGEDYSFTLVNEKAVENLIKRNPKLLPDPRVDVPKDKAWNRRKMNSALVQGILQGDSISKIAKRLMGVTDMNQHAAIRNARTMTTGAENAGRLDGYKYAQSLGIDLQKKWVATLDHVTRDSHVDVDGEVVDLDKNFSNGLEYPGAIGPPEEVYNCRCSMVSEVKGTTYHDNRYSKLGNMSYEQWKNEHRAHREAQMARKAKKG